MVILRPLIAALAVAAGWYGHALLPEPWNHAAIGGGVVIALAFILTASARATRRSPVVAKLGGMTWTTEDFCRGWLITGDTGSGKTRSGITPLLYQVFQNAPGWGGLCIDDKGLYWEYPVGNGPTLPPGKRPHSFASPARQSDLRLDSDAHL